VGTVHVPAESREADSAGAASLSFVPTSAWDRRRRKSRIERHTLGSAGRVHHDLPGHRAHRLSARPGKDVRLDESARAKTSAALRQEIRPGRARLKSCRSADYKAGLQPLRFSLRVGFRHQEEHRECKFSKLHRSNIRSHPAWAGRLTCRCEMARDSSPRRDAGLVCSFSKAAGWPELTDGVKIETCH
jgi:hypothetical protein